MTNSNKSMTEQTKSSRRRRFRLPAVLGALVVTMSLSHVPSLLGICIGALLLLWWRGVSLRHIFRRYLLIVPFAAGAVLFLPFTTAGQPAFTVFGFAATTEGVSLAFSIFLKISAANFMLTYLLADQSPFELIKQLRTLRVPEMLIMIMQMMIRYLYLLREELQTMLQAQRSRGMRAERRFWSRLDVRRFGQLLGALFVRSQVRGQHIYAAMSSRGGLAQDTFAAAADSGSQRIKGCVRLALKLKGVGYSYGTVRALRDVSFELPRGAKMALLGANGAGKSTLISLLNGLAIPEEGEVYVFDGLLDRDTRMSARRRVGVVYQDPDDQIFSPTVAEDVAFGPLNMGLSASEVTERVERALGSVGMREFRDCSPFELSYGQKRRVAIAGVLAMQPDVIIMDEPMAFLDPKGKAELQALLESLHLMGMTLMIATHDIDFAAEWADRVLILKAGSVYFEGGADALFDEALLSGAELPLPRLVQPFKLLNDIPAHIRPRTVREAAQWIWRLMMQREQKSEQRREREREHEREAAPLSNEHKID